MLTERLWKCAAVSVVLLASVAAAQGSRGQERGAALADYARRVREAVRVLEELASKYELVRQSEKYEVWSKEGFDSGFIAELPKRQEAALAKVRGLLPPKERVETGGSFVEVDNGWLHAALAESARVGDADKHAEALRDAAGRLRALEVRLGESERGASGEIDRDAERGRLNAILRAPEFDREAAPKGNALQRLIEQFSEWLSSLLPKGARIAPGASPGVSRLAQLFVLGLCLAVLVYVARRVWLRRGLKLKSLGLKRGARVVLGERLEEDQTAADLLEDAERLARAGELRGAIRKAYVALLCELGDRGVVRLAQHKTNRDYLNAVRRASRPRLYTEMLPLTSAFELHWYGLHDASAADWESFQTRCRRAIKETQETTEDR